MEETLQPATEAAEVVVPGAPEETAEPVEVPVE
mgnify:CR=1 FL=1